MTAEKLGEMTDVFSALADPTRVKIAGILAGGQQSVGDIATACGVPIVNISHHLSIMRNSKVVKSEKKGRNNFYSLTDVEVADGKMTIRKNGVCIMVDV